MTSHLNLYSCFLDRPCQEVEVEVAVVEAPVKVVDPSVGLDNEYDQKEVSLFKCGLIPSMSSLKCIHSITHGCHNILINITPYNMT